MIDNPFFVLGCVRSGTTLLRDLLKQHPNLACPEETHFFRWADPLGTQAYASNYARKRLFKEHRELDGVDNFDFFYTLQKTFSRRELTDHYMKLFLEANGLQGRRWFDKTPQNVYGIFLLNAAYPDAKFVHIHRHPYNVIASLRRGTVMKQQELNGAVNFWVEALTLVGQFRRFQAERLYEMRYEDLVAQPFDELNKLLAFLGEPALGDDQLSHTVHEERNLYEQVLSDEDIALINIHCGELMEQYGYDRR